MRSFRAKRTENLCNINFLDRPLRLAFLYAMSSGANNTETDIRNFHQMLEQTLIKVKTVAESLLRRPSASNMRSILRYLAGGIEGEPTREIVLKGFFDSLDTPKSYRGRPESLGTPGFTHFRNDTTALITSSTKISGQDKWMLAKINLPLIDTACTSHDDSRATKHAFPKLKNPMGV